MSTDFGALQAGELIPFAFPEGLAEPEKLLAAFFSSSTIGLCILDTELRFLAINKTLAAMNGIPAGNHLGKTVREVLGDFADVVEPQLLQVLATGNSVLNFEVTAVFPGTAEPIYAIDHFFPIKNANGAVTRIGVVVNEVTGERKLQESLLDATAKIRKQMQSLQMLLEVGMILAENWNVREVFPRISACIRRALRQEYAGFSLQDASTGLLVRQAEDFPLSRGFMAGVQIYKGHSPGSLAMSERTPLIFAKQDLQTFESEIAMQLLAEGLQSLCCIPLLRPQAPLGVLVLGSTRKDAFHPEDLTLLSQVAQQLAVAIENHRAAAEIGVLKQRLTAERRYLEGEIRSKDHFAEIIGESPLLKGVLDEVATVAASDATVLILGETGTGKELVARGIHRMSRRADRAFIRVNCAAIPTGLLESELFGHEKGAFTGAILQKIGRMELADGGTLFLDEVGEIALELQPKLLRVLQDHEFERLGSTRTVKVDLRLIAATNRDLERSVKEGEFRSDLFYRLHVFPVRLPALRERREDIPLLVRYFVRRFARRLEKHIETIPKEAMELLKNWSWPGNVRELENLMERSVLLSDGPVLRVPLSELQVRSTAADPSDHTLDTAEREHIIRVLRETNGVISGPNGAAQRLGLKRTTLQSKMQRLQISRQEYFHRGR
ncbi:MAG TPA: sigma 54-interacting transcriptional regulator [Verrucomicrobiae bacterium]|nr:sigma 54-interacting transcriptional regulator [Verrucomicrobiae bacterium]